MTYARLERADEHLREIHQWAGDICSAQAKTTRVTAAPGRTLTPGELGQLFAVESANTPIPDRIRLLVGDVVNSLRSSLDYLVHELAELSSGKGRRRTQFPVEESLDKFNGRRQTFLKGVSDADVTYIETLQPYNGSSWTTKLSRLSNWDKHNKLVLVVHDYVLGGSITTGEVSISSAGEIPFQVQLSLQPSLRVQLEDGFQLLESLEEVRSGIASTLEHFAPKFNMACGK